MGDRVLVFGDSMTHRGGMTDPEQVEVRPGDGLDRGSAPGDLLASHLLAQGLASAARLDARIGRSAYNFWRRESAETLLRADLDWAPTLVILMLGTNDAGLNQKVNEKSMRAIHDWLGSRGAEVWGIGPPAFADTRLTRDSEAVVAMMRRVFGHRFLDARPLTQDLTQRGRAGDRVHFSDAGSRIFAARLVDAFTRARRWLWLHAGVEALATTFVPAVSMVLAATRRTG